MANSVKSRSDTKPEIRRLVERIQMSWKKSATLMLECGEQLERLKALTSRAQFINELKRIGMSEQTAMRILKCWRRWGKNPPLAVLDANPSVLYIAASSTDERVEQLVRGASVMIDGRPRQLKSLAVAEAKRLQRRRRRNPDLHAKAPDEICRDLCTLLQKLHALTFDAEPIIAELDQPQAKLMAIALKEALECLKRSYQQCRGR